MFRQNQNSLLATTNKITLFLIAIILTTAILSCEKNKLEKHYEKDKELHTFFRCKVNGQEWHSDHHGYRSTISYYTDTYAPQLDIAGGLEAKIQYTHDDKDEYIYIYIRRDLEEGDNLIDNRISYIYRKFKTVYYLDTNNYNNLFITDIDSTNKVITGEFEFRAMTDDGLDTVYVTDGEFDWKVYWYE